MINGLFLLFYFFFPFCHSLCLCAMLRVHDLDSPMSFLLVRALNRKWKKTFFLPELLIQTCIGWETIYLVRRLWMGKTKELPFHSSTCLYYSSLYIKCKIQIKGCFISFSFFSFFFFFLHFSSCLLYSFPIYPFIHSLFSSHFHFNINESNRSCNILQSKGWFKIIKEHSGPHKHTLSRKKYKNLWFYLCTIFILPSHILEVKKKKKVFSS